MAKCLKPCSTPSGYIILAKGKRTKTRAAFDWEPLGMTDYNGTPIPMRRCWATVFETPDDAEAALKAAHSALDATPIHPMRGVTFRIIALTDPAHELIREATARSEAATEEASKCRRE